MTAFSQSSRDALVRWACATLAGNLRSRLRRIERPTAAEIELISTLTSFLRENNVADTE